MPAIYKTRVEKFEDSPLWDYHIVVPNEIADQFVAESKRITCSIDGHEPIQRALMHDGSGGYFILLSKTVRKKLGLIHLQEVEVSLETDNSEYGLPCPPEFRELLDQDEEGNALFHALTPGKQRNLLYIIGQPKREETRLKKAIVILEHLKSTGGLIDFKQLMADFKAANRR